MRCLGRLIGLGLAFIFVVIFPCSLWGFNIHRIALDLETYDAAFADEDFHENLAPGVLPALLEGFEENPPPPGALSLLQIIEHADQRAWEDVTPVLVPTEWVEYEVETNLETFTNWLEGDTDDLILIFHNETLRRRLSSDDGQAAIRSLVEQWPACSLAEQRAFNQYRRGVVDVEFPYCIPPTGQGRDTLEEMVSDAILHAAEVLPSELNVLDEMEQAIVEENDHDPFTRDELNFFRSSIRLWRRVVALYLLLPLAVLSSIVIFAVRSFKTFFRWIGWSLLLGSVLAVLPLFMFPFVLHDFSFESEIEGGFATGGALLAEITGERMFRLLIGEFTFPVLFQSIVLIGVGFLFAVLSVLVNDPDAPPEPVILANGVQMPSGSSTSARGETRTQLDDTPMTAHTPPPDQRGDT